MSETDRLVSVDYEVHGLVQGVFFRKYTLSAAKDRGLKGWVKNTRRGTVVGVIQGDRAKVEDMKRWLVNVGSPQSVIQGCEFREEREIINPDYKDFTVSPSGW